ncbi:hypothetical protein PFISCL1PPCAC_626, partial [Pristionchus fissidentatus]
LIHWPVIVFRHSWILTVKLHFEDAFICFSISLAISIVIHHFYEKWLLTKSFNYCFIISTTLYVISLGMLRPHIPQTISNRLIDYNQDGNSTLRELMEWNHRESLSCCINKPDDCKRDWEAELLTDWRKEVNSRCISVS